MKSIDKFITEAKKNKVTFDYDPSPKWIRMTCGVDYAGEPVIIFGEPCSRDRQQAWDQGYKSAKQMGGSSFTMVVYQNLEKNFENVENEIGEKLDEQQCLCICYLPNHDEWTVYVYGPDGVEAIK